MNDIWEDAISLTVIVLALAAYLMLLDAILEGQMMQDSAAEKYRRAHILGEALAAQWAYDGGMVLDPAKICSACPSGASAAVYDMRKKQKLCGCGSFANGTVAKRPAAVRYDYGDVAPALIEVRLN